MRIATLLALGLILPLAACTAEREPLVEDPCGDGTIGAGEKCDPGITSGEGACPASCDDTLACTTDTLTGTAAACSAECAHVAITACIPGDGCCAPGCHALNDSDCAPHCGNGTVEPPELCDGNCPASCNDGSACTTDSITGTAGSCDVKCVNTPVTTCVGGDGCCAGGCNANDDTDCSASCGNGTREGTETCDGDCPTSCDDDLACTTDALTGSASGCSVACTHLPVTLCVGGDGCCPAGCNLNTDADCPQQCGNGVREGTEVCDGTCPTTCNDSNACTVDVLAGAVANCDVICVNTTITACVGGDGCCAAGCNANNDTDCSPSCGNGVREGTETCDGDCPASCADDNACTTDSLTGSSSNCTARCVNSPISTCTAGDGCCPAGCNLNTDSDCPQKCGNGVREGTEICDGNCPASCSDGSACTTDTATGSASNCDLACTSVPVTACVANDGCCPRGCNSTTDRDCSASCGNDVLEAGETCDGDCPLDCADDNACTTDLAVGNRDTCSLACTHVGITACAPGDGCCPAGCTSRNDADCSVSCGNSVVERGETCDGNCPTGCDDQLACTRDVLVGSAANCSAQCSHQAITQCQAGDGCCAPGCVLATDADCVPAGKVGDRCTSGGECVLGACLDEATRTWPGGYCTATCTSDANCGTSGHCAFKDASGVGSCLRNCNQASDCRGPAYECFDDDHDGSKECSPVSSGTGAVGDPCRSFLDCGGGQLGACLRESQGWKDGLCTRTCSSSVACPSSSRCVAIQPNGWGVCLPTCTADGQCRGDGYLCDQIEPTGSKVCYVGATGTKPIGAACATDWECGGGHGGGCLEQSTNWRDGYCSKECSNTVACPTGSHCGYRDTSGAGVCIADCVSNGVCRTDGYLCFDDDATSGLECAPAATGTKAPGSACAGDWECAGGPWGYCYTGASYPGGYCFQQCAPGRVTCPSGSSCIDVDSSNPNGKICFDQCTAKADCRAGYECRVIDSTTNKYCAPPQ